MRLLLFFKARIEAGTNYAVEKKVFFFESVTFLKEIVLIEFENNTNT